MGTHQRRLLSHGFKQIESLIRQSSTAVSVRDYSVVSSLSQSELLSTETIIWVDKALLLIWLDKSETTCWRLQIALGKVERADSPNYLGYAKSTKYLTTESANQERSNKNT